MTDRAGAVAVSKRLARELGQAPERKGDIHSDLRAGVLSEQWVQSRSQPRWYHLVRTAGGWQHADLGCMAWQIRSACAHVQEANMETALTTTSPRVLAMVDEIEDQQIVEAIRGDLTEVWVYEFPQGGSTVTGVSSKGVENGCRELGKQGEAIREVDVKIEYEDEREARFIAQAGRYAISHDGKEVLLDVAIRAKRQSKWMKLRSGGEQADEHWYEKGITKAVRNAKLALMPDSVVAMIIGEARKHGRTQRVQKGGQPQRQEREQPKPDAVTDNTLKAVREAYKQTMQGLDEAPRKTAYDYLVATWGHAFTANGAYMERLTESEAFDVMAYLHDQLPQQGGGEQARMGV